MPISQLNAENWHSICESLALTGMTKALIVHARFASFTHPKLVLHVAANTSILAQPTHQKRVAAAVCQLFGDTNVQTDILINENNANLTTSEKKTNDHQSWQQQKADKIKQSQGFKALNQQLEQAVNIDPAAIKSPEKSPEKP